MSKTLGEMCSAGSWGIAEFLPLIPRLTNACASRVDHAMQWLVWCAVYKLLTWCGRLAAVSSDKL